MLKINKGIHLLVSGISAKTKEVECRFWCWLIVEFANHVQMSYWMNTRLNDRIAQVFEWLTGKSFDSLTNSNFRIACFHIMQIRAWLMLIMFYQFLSFETIQFLQVFACLNFKVCNSDYQQRYRILFETQTDWCQVASVNTLNHSFMSLAYI